VPCVQALTMVERAFGERTGIMNDNPATCETVGRSIRLNDITKLSVDQIQEETVKHKLMSAFAVIALMLAVSSPSPAFGKHPEIEDALHALKNAKEHLQQAAHDFGGHRVDAIRAIDEADRQLRICMQY